jgi:PAS domain S-box-containing protein
MQLREDDYRRLWATSLNAVLVLDEHASITLASPACLKVFGYSPEELVGKPVSLLQPDGDGSRSAWQSGEAMALHRDGRAFPIEISLTEFGRDGETYHAVFVRDISERKEAERAMKKNEERYRALVENFPGGNVSLFDKDFRLLFVGGEDAMKHGYPEKLVGKTLSEVAPPETRAVVEPNLRLAFQGQKVTYVTPFTGGISYQATATPIFSSNGEVNEVLVVAANITEQERARFALQESEERFRLLAEVTNDAIWDWDLITNELWWNEGFESLFGYCRDATEKTFESWYSRIHDAERDRVISGLRRIVDDGGTNWSEEYRFLCKNGSYAYVVDRGHVIRNYEGKPIRMVGGMRDLTERKRAEEAAQAFPAELLRAQDEERRRIARELHDSTAQELAVVAMNLGRLEDWIEGRDAWAENLLADSLAVLNQGNRDLRTLAHLLHPPMLEELGLIGALRDYVAGFSGRSGIKVDLEAADQFERCSGPVETALFRVVQESLSNVHRHSGSKVALVRLVRARNVIELTITDRGKGLPAGLLSGTADGVRVGVGISGMRQRIVQLQGKLELSSDESGTTVSAVLPFV